MAPKKAVQQARGACVRPPWHESRIAACTARVRTVDVLSDSLFTSARRGFLHIDTPAPALQLHHPFLDSDALTPSSCACAQVNKADKCRTHEQQTQQKQEKQRNQHKQKQQKQTGGGKNCVSSLSPDPAGTASADGIEARIPVI